MKPICFVCFLIEISQRPLYFRLFKAYEVCFCWAFLHDRFSLALPLFESLSELDSEKASFKIQTTSDL